MLNKKKFFIGTFFAIIIIILLIRNIDFANLNSYSLKNDFKLIYLVLAFPILILANIIRAIRFNYILDNSFKLSEIFSITVYYNFYTTIFPGGIGELSFVHLIKKNVKENFPIGLSGIFMTRLYDLLMMTLFLGGTISIINVEKIDKWKLWVSILIIAIGLISLLRYSSFLIRKINSGFIFLSKRYNWAANFSGFLKQTENILTTNNEKNKIVFGLSFVYWAITFFVIQMFFWSIGIKLSYSESILMGTISNIITIIPLNTFGGFGYKESGLTLGLILLKIAKSDAIILSFIFHLISITFTALLALVGLAINLTKKTLKPNLNDS